MRNIDNSEWIGKPRLDVIETREEDNRRTATFVLRADQIVPSTEDAEGNS
jgi:hypothetical protein